MKSTTGMESKIWLHSIIKDDTPIEDAEEEESRNVLAEKCVLRYFSSFAFVCLLLGCCCLRFTACSNIKGTLSLDKNHFDDGNYLILTVNVIQNSYFRWHDLGIPATNSVSFYDFSLKAVLDKFKTFTITFYNDDSILISSSVNHNQITLHFTFTNQKEKDWFNRKEKKFYNNKCK